MGARVIDGRGLTAELKVELAAEVAGLRDAGVVPTLANVLVGASAEAAVYERRVRSLAGELTIFAGSARGKGSSDDREKNAAL
jgi:5,10-methylene-tetrahydrofolate dehydrogenase/methenyl tetrahydrofolate cyclohydrolase